MLASTLRAKLKRLGQIGILLALWTGAAGCDVFFGEMGSLLGLGLPPVVAASVEMPELGDEWAAAQSVALPQDGSVRVTGRIDNKDDADVFDLGQLERGDRIVIETEQDPGLDAAAGLFDDRTMLLNVNDDRSYSLGLYDPFIDHIVREDLPHCYLVVATSPYQVTTGNYTITISRRPDTEVPDPRGQVVLLDFDGEDGVRIGGRRPLDVPIFDAADIDSRYTGQTSAIVDIIESMVREEYADYDVSVYSTAEGGDPAGDVTRVFFGTYDADLLGLADTVDLYNTRQVEECIVFTETFDLFMPLSPSPEQMATALGNVAAHELGHLLGLNHTRDATEIMDVTASAYQLLADQSLHMSPLEESIFPIGWQDPHILLMHALGAR